MLPRAIIVSENKSTAIADVKQICPGTLAPLNKLKFKHERNAYIATTN